MISRLTPSQRGSTMHLQVLDLDGSLAAQTSLRDAAAWASVDALVEPVTPVATA
jgi:hypothetical protein